MDRLRTSSEQLECVIVGAGVQGRAHARTVEDVLAGVREVSVTFISRSESAELPYPRVESGSAAADEALCRAGLVVVATSAGGNLWSSIGNCALIRLCLLWGAHRGHA